MEEESGETASEVGEEAFRHRSKMSLDIFWQVLIVVFLTNALNSRGERVIPMYIPYFAAPVEDLGPISRRIYETYPDFR